MSLAIRLQAEPLRSVGFAALGGAYSTLGTPMSHPIRLIVLQNFTDTGVMISFNGIDDHLPMVEDGYMILDVTSNKTISQGFFLAEGQQLYVKQLGAPATSGSVYLSVFYGVEV